MSDPIHIVIDDTPLDTLTVKFWRDMPGPNYKGTEQPGWACHIGENFIEGSGGFGPTPLAALRNLCDQIAADEGHRTDGGLIFLR
jgi:hypothetical protein